LDWRWTPLIGLGFLSEVAYFTDTFGFGDDPWGTAVMTSALLTAGISGFVRLGAVR